MNPCDSRPISLSARAKVVVIVSYHVPPSCRTIARNQGDIIGLVDVKILHTFVKYRNRECMTDIINLEEMCVWFRLLMNFHFLSVVSAMHIASYYGNLPS